MALELYPPDVWAKTISPAESSWGKLTLLLAVGDALRLLPQFAADYYKTKLRLLQLSHILFIDIDHILVLKNFSCSIVVR